MCAASDRRRYSAATRSVSVVFEDDERKHPWRCPVLLGICPLASGGTDANGFFNSGAFDFKAASGDVRRLQQQDITVAINGATASM